jgi:flagellar hook-associated protein 1 FlgK
MGGALQADQEALNVTANNVANANTPGYAVEAPTWRENQPILVNGISIGNGVSETGAASQRDRVLEERLDQQQQLASASSTRLTALNNIQALFAPDSGSSGATAGDIGSDITSFFDAFSSLANSGTPTNNALRQAVLSAANTLASDISGAAGSLNTQSEALDQGAAGVASQVNSLTSSIAELNLEIQSNSPHADAGTLEDERQEDLSQLSQLVGINQVTTENNGLTVTTTSGRLLVSEGQNFQMTTGTVNGVTDFFLSGTDISTELRAGGGQLGGYLTARDVDIPNAIASLDQLANGIATAVNAQNSAGKDLDGVTGTAANPLNIFGAPAQVAGSAAGMSVVMTDSDQIAAAGAANGTGDNSNAVLLAALANGKIAGNPAQTPINFYSNFVSTLGSTVTAVESENTAQNASVTQLKTQNNALSSVNLNDEAAALSRLETSYQAASQMFTVLNTIMASALNLGDQTAVS